LQGHFIPASDGRVALPDAPGIGFERKSDLWAVMREIA
jgi:L-alanine-DL-glutamate epimerase-like enolase superfamily enzyme